MRESLRKRVELLLSILALVVAVVSFTMSFMQSQNAAVTGVMPVLGFVYDEDGRWVLQNLGNGPAMNIVVAIRQNDTAGWCDPVRLPPLAQDGKLALRWVGLDVRWLGASYTDVEGRKYTATCVNDLSVSHRGQLLPTWPEADIAKHWDRVEPAPDRQCRQ